MNANIGTYDTNKHKNLTFVHDLPTCFFLPTTFFLQNLNFKILVSSTCDARLFFLPHQTNN